MDAALEKPDYRRVMRLVKELHSQFGYKEPPINPVEIAKSKDIPVKFVKFKPNMKASVSGFYDADDHMIYVNSDEFPLRQTFTIAHELGHALLHKDWASSIEYKVMLRDSESMGDNPYEREANFFAAHLLVPRFMLDKYVQIMNYYELSKLFAVSVPTIQYRLKNEYGY